MTFVRQRGDDAKAEVFFVIGFFTLWVDSCFVGRGMVLREVILGVIFGPSLHVVGTFKLIIILCRRT